MIYSNYSKKKCLFAAMAIISAMMSGCSAESGEAPGDVPEQEVNNYVTAADDVTVTGEVTGIVGNRVTLRLSSSDESGRMHSGKRSEMWEGERPEMPEGERPEMPEGERPEMHEGERPEMPEGERPEMPEGQRPEMPEGQRPEMFEGERPEMSEGEPSEMSGKTDEEVYIIPVGMVIDGLSGRKNDYSGITEGMQLTLTVSSDGTVRACAAGNVR